MSETPVPEDQTTTPPDGDDDETSFVDDTEDATDPALDPAEPSQHADATPDQDDPDGGAA